MSPKKILLVANTAWNLWNYRQALTRALQDAGFEVVLAAPGDRFISLLETRFVPLLHLSRRSFSFFQNLRTLLELYHLFRRERPDVVLLYTIKPNILGNVAAWLACSPTVSVVEGLGHSGTSAAQWRWLAAPLYRLALRSARRVIFLNHDDAQAFLQQKIAAPAQIAVIPGPGVDTDYFCPPTTPRTPSTDTVFLFFGRLLSEKGIHEFVEAAHMVARLGGVRAEFRVLGSPDPGNPATVLEEQVGIWQHAGIVQFIGAADDVRPHVAAADVLVVTVPLTTATAAMIAARQLGLMKPDA
ncbi:MAG: glycosyltransferase, partial [Saprospiraceae bacterium]